MRGDARLRPFIPRWTRVSSLVIGVLLAVGTGAVLWRISEETRNPGGEPVVPIDIVLILLVAVVGLALLWRLGGVRADPSSQGLRVRNVIRTRTVAWAEILAVSFTPSNAWVFVDLADGTRLAVMGIQQSDGRRARREAARLSYLVAEFGTATDPRGGPSAPSAAS